MARRRHVDALLHARDSLQQAGQVYADTRSAELVAEDLRIAQMSLNEITGEFTPENLLGRIFSTFCIGK
jgi:tRNA modification GTPase